MADSQPHHPPQAAVASVGNVGDGTFQAVRVWSWRGRLGRLRFLAYGTVAYLILGVLSVGIGFAAGLFGAAGLFPVLFLLLLIPYLVFQASVTIRRSHDMGWSGWMSLLALIPLVGLIWLFKGGDRDANAYGAPPPPNSTGVKWAAFGTLGLLAFTVLIGIVAAIALPAYQQYTQRAAEAAQQAPSR